MKLTDFRKNLPIKIQTDMWFGHLHELVGGRHESRYAIDFDVYLPSKGKNLQRPFCWTLEQKRELILSVLKGVHIQNFTVIIAELTAPVNNIRAQKTIRVIDGKQRLSTLISFMHDEFTFLFDGTEYLYSELPEEIQQEIANFNIHFNQAYEYWDDMITDDNKIAWFEQINFAGTPQDIEHMKNLRS